MSSRLTIAEIAARLEIGRDAVYELLNSGKIPSIRVRQGGRFIVTRHAFEEWERTCGFVTAATSSPKDWIVVKQ